MNTNALQSRRVSGLTAHDHDHTGKGTLVHKRKFSCGSVSRRIVIPSDHDLRISMLAMLIKDQYCGVLWDKPIEMSFRHAKNDRFKVCTSVIDSFS